MTAFVLQYAAVLSSKTGRKTVASGSSATKVVADLTHREIRLLKTGTETFVATKGIFLCSSGAVDVQLKIAPAGAFSTAQTLNGVMYLPLGCEVKVTNSQGSTSYDGGVTLQAIYE